MNKILIATAALFVAFAAAPASAIQSNDAPKSTQSIACRYCAANGLSLNGINPNGQMLNGTRMNGTKVNGTKVNGTKVNGTKVNGGAFNGTRMNGRTSGSMEQMVVRAVVLANGTVVTLK